ELREHPRRPRADLPGNPERGQVPAELLDLVAVDQQRAVVADLHDLVEPLAGVPLQPPRALILRQPLAGLAVDEQVRVVLPRSLTLAAQAAVVAVHLPAHHPLERFELEAHQLLYRARALERLREQAGVDLARLAGDDARALREIPAEHVVALPDRMVRAFDLDELDQLLTDHRDPLERDV